MTLKIVVSVMFTAFAFGAFGGSAANAVSRIPPVDGVGAIGTCSLVAAVQFTPGLTVGGTNPAVRSKFKGMVTPCTGATGDALSIRSGGIKGGTIGAFATSSCAVLGTTGLTSFPLTVKWKVVPKTPPLNPSFIVVNAAPSSSIGVGTGPNGSITMTLTGTVTYGSFKGNAIALHVVTDESQAAYIAACNAAAAFRGFHFTGVNGASTFTG